MELNAYKLDFLDIARKSFSLRSFRRSLSRARGIFDLIRIRYIIFLNIPFMLSAFVLARNFDLQLIFFVCLSYFFAHFFINAVNDLYDIETDKVHPVKSIENPIVSGKISFKDARYITIALPFLALLSAIPTNPIWFSAILFVDFIGWSYSVPPIRTRARPWGFLTNETLGSGVGFVWTYWAAKPAQSDWSFWIIPMTLYILFSHAILVSKDLPDIDPDRKAGFDNFAIAYGVKTTQRFVILCTLASFIIYVYLLASHVFSVISLPFAIIGTILPLRSLSKPLEQITDRYLIYQRVMPASIFYSIALVLGVFGMLFMPW